MAAGSARGARTKRLTPSLLGVSATSSLRPHRVQGGMGRLLPFRLRLPASDLLEQLSRELGPVRVLDDAVGAVGTTESIARTMGSCALLSSSGC